MADTTVTRQPPRLDGNKPPVLVVLHTPDQSFTQGHLVLLRGELSLGREPGPGGLTLDDPAVSRCHARLRFDSKRGLAELEDQRSKNGTFVNGKAVVRTYLNGGEVLRMGDTLFAVREVRRVSDVQLPDFNPRDGTFMATYPIGGKLKSKEGPTAPLPAIAGASPPIADLKRRLAMLAATQLPLLLIGEPGTGRKLAARTAHEASGRSGPLKAVDCTAIPGEQFPKTLFGSAGALAPEEGSLVSNCDGGTLYLDDIALLPPQAYPLLLEFIETAGSRATAGIDSDLPDVRFIFGASRTLDPAAIRIPSLSELLGKLEGLAMSLPPLRHRREDILILASHFARREAGIESLFLDTDAAEALLIARWPDNVRGLHRLLVRLARTTWPERRHDAGSAKIFVDDLPDELAGPVRHRKA